MDGCGNIALGYNVSGLVTKPGIRCTGRLAGDPLGAMTAGDLSLQEGLFVSPESRWGDYSSMNVDELNPCKFFYTAEFVETATSWGTRIGSFSFDGCAGLDSDGDTALDCIDDCVDLANPDQVDTDGDEIGDACDECPDGYTVTGGWTDTCGDGSGVSRPNEFITLDIILRSTSTSPLPDITGTLTTLDPLVAIPVGTATFTWDTPGPSGTRARSSFAVVVDMTHACPAAIDFTLALTGPPGCRDSMQMAALSLGDCDTSPQLVEPPEVPTTSVRVRKEVPDAVRVLWVAPAAVSVFDVYRGSIDSLFVSHAYDHAASLTAGGACAVPADFYDGPGELLDGEDYYYLVTAVCGLTTIQGTAGFDSFGVERPAGIGCPP
jgi:hypothetical protein